MKYIKYIIIIIFQFILVSCPFSNSAHYFTTVLYTRQPALIPNEPINIHVDFPHEINEDWMEQVTIGKNVLLSFSNKVSCVYGVGGRMEKIKEISSREAVYLVPINVAFGQYDDTIYLYDGIIGKKIIYPSILSLSNPVAQVGDEITITSTKPFFDVDTFSNAKMKLLKEIKYKVVWVKKRGGCNARIGIPIQDCTVDSPYSVKFKVPENTVSEQVLVINEGGFEAWLSPNDCDVEATREKYINFDTTSCERYAYYATKTELLILDASGDRVD